MAKKTYKFDLGPNSTLKHGYARLTLDDKSQVEVDPKDPKQMSVVEYFGGEEVKPKPKKATVKTTTKKDDK